jgi:hypothetical protein
LIDSGLNDLPAQKNTVTQQFIERLGRNAIVKQSFNPQSNFSFGKLVTFAVVL